MQLAFALIDHFEKIVPPEWTLLTRALATVADDHISNTNLLADVSLLAAAMAAIPVTPGDPHDEWIKVGMALHQEAIEAGVLYVSCEDEMAEIHRRVEKIVASEAGLSFADLSKLHVLDLTVTLSTELVRLGPDRQSLQLTDLYVTLAAELADRHPRLVILDTRADVFAGNEMNRVKTWQASCAT